VEGDPRHVRVGDRLDHLRAVLDDAAGLGLGADDETGGVVQIDQRRVRLIAQLHELCCLGGAIRRNRPVGADHAAGMPHDRGMAADRLLIIFRLEFKKIGQWKKESGSIITGKVN